MTSAKDTDSLETPERTCFGIPLSALAVCIALSLTVGLIGMDGTIVGVATPEITTDLGSLGDVGWLGSAYFLAAAASQLVFGALNRVVPHKHVYIAGIFLFELGCLLAGLANTSTMCIVGRAFSGLGCSGVVSTSLVLVTEILPPARLPLMIGVLGAMELVGQITGPLIGGALTDNASWRWCFLINVPMGTVAGAVVFFLLRTHRKPWKTIFQELKLIDGIGILILTPAIALILFVVQSGGNTFAWNSAQSISMLTVGFALLVALVFWEHRKGEAAVIPLTLFKNRSISFAAAFAVAAGMAMALFDYYIPLWNQVIKGYSAARSGILLLPLNACSAVGVMAGGLLANTIGRANPVMLLGGTLTAIVSGLFSTITMASTDSLIMGISALAGFAALASQQPIVVAHNAVETKLSPTAISMMLFSSMVGSAISLAIAQAVFLNKLQGNLRLVQGVDVDKIIRSGATELRHIVDPSLLPKVLELYNLSIVQVFYMALAAGIAMTIASLLVKWTRILEKKPKDAETCEPSPVTSAGTGVTEPEDRENTETTTETIVEKDKD
ncbi:MFS transporter [Colletotrichum lupini]|uniref:MFS transporter n=1 Tax=Colletotrichum lupini TaxID=145971 RepID=A0A9Q8WAI2_9PEZI|nr:MFS transporter [Colletotrichum lupini]UQC75652.1 MFS transporter [Colletotrichum lupini]